MSAIDPWLPFLEIPKSLACTSMHLHGRDLELPLLEGSGSVTALSSSSFEYRMIGAPRSEKSLVEFAAKAQQHRYDALRQFRLSGVDDSGTHWNFGYVGFTLDRCASGSWSAQGSCTSLHSGSALESQQSGVELAFLPGTFVPTEESKRIISCLGSVVTLYQREGCLRIDATASAELKHPLLENMITEPLRIMLGKLVYPRVVMRHTGQGNSHVSVRRVPDHVGQYNAASIIGRRVLSLDDYWEVYRLILEYIAKIDATEDLVDHKITSYYHEIIQACAGSRWVLCLTLASVAEGLLRKLPLPPDPPSLEQTKRAASVQSLITHLRSWNEDKDIRGKAISWASTLNSMGTKARMKQLASHGLIAQQGCDAWISIRDSVMHGNLIVPWSTERGDSEIQALVLLVHTLASRVMRLKL